MQQASQKQILRLHLGDACERASSEFALLGAITQVGLSVPQPIKFYVDEECCGMLLGFLAGSSPDPQLVTPQQMSQIGRFLAQLHQSAIQPNQRPHLDWDGLFGKDGVYALNNNAQTIFTDEQTSTMQTVTERVRLAMDSLGKSSAEYGFVHGDFLLKNVLFDGDMLHGIDFEYCGWGYFLYDLTPLLWQLKAIRHDYADLAKALWSGYVGVRPLDDHHQQLLETFIAGRQVASMRWVANNQHNPHVAGKVPQILQQRTQELQEFLATGYLRRN